MKAFYSEKQVLHDPQQFMRLGKIHKPTDSPARIQQLQEALSLFKVALSPADHLGLDEIKDVHSPYYIDFLASVYQRWQQLKTDKIEPGIEVLPNLSPYYNGRIGMQRPPCPSDSVVAQAGYYIGDLSCPVGPNTWQTIVGSAHSAASAAYAICEGETLAYSLCRPPGHHAHYDRAAGFCYINSNAVAANILSKKFKRVVVLDVDAHHGDGTQNIFYERSDVFTVSLHADTHNYYPFYTGYKHEVGYGEGEGYNLNMPLAHGTDTSAYVVALDQALQKIADYKPDVILLALGFDTYKDDPLSVLKFDFDAYKLTGKRLKEFHVPLVVVQEGGYMIEALKPGLSALLEGLGV